MTDRGLDAYIRFYETMSPDSLSELDRLVTPDVIFRDPFNEVQGPEAMRRIFTHMFDTVAGPRFYVTHRAFDGAVCFLRWRFTGIVAAMGKRPWTVEGVSEIHFGEDGKIRAHIDHWDAAGQFYARLPVVGPIFRLIRRRARAR